MAILFALDDAKRDAARASFYRRTADSHELAGNPELAKLYREAAWRQDESAAWLSGKRVPMTEADLAELREEVADAS